jgi:hypothetical protein
MTAPNERKRKNDRPICTRDQPIRRDDALESEDGHRRKARKRYGERQPEPFENPGDLDEKVGSLYFLLRCAPRDVVGEHVCEEGYGEVDAQTPEEEEATSSKRVLVTAHWKTEGMTDKNSIQVHVSMVESMRLR